MGEGERRLDGNLNTPKVFRTATVRAESGNYIYSFEPALSMGELRQSPDYDSLVKSSLAVGGFRAKVALTPSGEGQTFLELAISSSAPREYVGDLFDRLRSSRIADIQTGLGAFRSSLDDPMPKTEEERAIVSLIEKKLKAGGGIITATVHFDARGLQRVGYTLTKDGVEIGFVPVKVESTDAARLIVSLTSTLDNYMSRLSRTH